MELIENLVVRGRTLESHQQMKHVRNLRENRIAYAPHPAFESHRVNGPRLFTKSVADGAKTPLGGMNRNMGWNAAKPGSKRHHQRERSRQPPARGHHHGRADAILLVSSHRRKIHVPDLTTTRTHRSPELRWVCKRHDRTHLVDIVLPRHGIRAKTGECFAHLPPEFPASSLEPVRTRAQPRDPAPGESNLATSRTGRHQSNSRNVVNRGGR